MEHCEDSNNEFDSEAEPLVQEPESNEQNEQENEPAAIDAAAQVESEFSEDSFDAYDLNESSPNSIYWSDIEIKNNRGCSRLLLSD